MKSVTAIVLNFLLLACSINTKGQALNDSTILLSYEWYMANVQAYHPIVKQAGLVVNSAQSDVLKSRGSFDPKLFYNFNNKFYSEQEYWKFIDGGVKIPTWFGIEVQGGFEQNSGKYINLEKTLPESGLLYTKISVPLAQGLIIDQRRATLKRAKIMLESSQFERNALVNDVLYNAGQAYWDWYLAYSNTLVYSNALSIAQERFEAVLQSAKLGDRPYIDTLEASIWVQERNLNYLLAQRDFVIATFQLSNFIWRENNIPLELTTKVQPVIYNQAYLNEDKIFTRFDSIEQTLVAHPELMLYNFKAQNLDLERKLKADQLKPNINVDYNPLTTPNNDAFNNYFNNYKWGVTLEFPLFLRKERGDLQITKFKIQDNNYSYANKQNSLRNKINAMVNNYNITKDQITRYTKTVQDYEALWQAEKRLFEAGESSVFMVNSREMSFINARIKLNDIIYKNKKAGLEAEFAIGQMSLDY